MMIDIEMLGVLIGISTGTWLLVNRIFAKSFVKTLVGYIHSKFLSTPDPLGRTYSLVKIQSYAVWIMVVLIAAGLVVLSHATNMYVIVKDMTELQYAAPLSEATFVKCFMQIEPVEYSLLWYFDILSTIGIVSVGSQLMHRLESYFNFKYQNADNRKAIS